MGCPKNEREVLLISSVWGMDLFWNNPLCFGAGVLDYFARCIKLNKQWNDNSSIRFANFTHSRDQGSLHPLVLQSRDCIFRFFNLFLQTLPTVAIKEVCTRWFYNQGTVSFGFSIFYFNIMRNCVKVTNLWQSSFLSI